MADATSHRKGPPPSVSDQPLDDGLLIQVHGEAAKKYILTVAIRENRDIGDYARGHPEFETEILSVLPVLSLLQSSHLNEFEPKSLNAPKQLGDFRLLNDLTGGAMGVVYEAEHLVMGRLVALMVMRRKLTHHPRALQLFRNEVRAVAWPEYLDIVRAHDAETIRSLGIVVMELIDGDTAQELIRKPGGPLAIDQACRCISNPCIGLQHAHKKRLARPDIKPSNMIVDRRTGQTRLLDLGVVYTRSQKSPTLQRVGRRMIGTCEHIAPEQEVDANDADCRADTYSLGYKLHYLPTALLAFEHENPERLLLLHQSQIATQVHETRPNTRLSLSRIILRFMSQRPADRRSTPREIAEPFAPCLYAAAVDQSHAELLRLAIRPRSRKAKPLHQRAKRGFKIELGLTPLVLAVALIVALRTSTGTIVLDGLPRNAEITVDGKSITANHDSRKLILREIEIRSHKIAVHLDGRNVATNDARVPLSGQEVLVKFADKLESGVSGVAGWMGFVATPLAREYIGLFTKSPGTSPKSYCSCTPTKAFT